MQQRSHRPRRLWYWGRVRKFSSVVPALIVSLLGCTPPSETPPAAEAPAGPRWIDIDETEDRMLVTVGAGRQREAVVDVPWTAEMRSKAVADGFARAKDAKVTRALYRFDCNRLLISTRSYSVLSEKGETLTSQLFPDAKASAVEPGATAARYLVTACEGELAPATKAKLLPPAQKP